jgi:GntR family transcriptional regulator
MARKANGCNKCGRWRNTRSTDSRHSDPVTDRAADFGTDAPHYFGSEPKSARQRSARRVYDLLRAAIRSGAVEQRDLFVEHDLIRTFGASRSAVREALQMLVDDGLVIRAPRIGTVLTGTVHEVSVTVPSTDNDVPGHYTIEKLDERTITSPFLAHRIEADHDRLALQEYRMFIEGQPMSVITIYASASHVRTAPYFDSLLDRTGAFERRFGVGMGHTESSIEAVACEPRTARLLTLADHAPVLRLETLIFDETGRPRELSYSHYRADRIAMTVRDDSPGRN